MRTEIDFGDEHAIDAVFRENSSGQVRIVVGVVAKPRIGTVTALTQDRQSQRQC